MKSGAQRFMDVFVSIQGELLELILFKTSYHLISNLVPTFPHIINIHISLFMYISHLFTVQQFFFPPHQDIKQYTADMCYLSHCQ